MGNTQGQSKLFAIYLLEGGKYWVGENDISEWTMFHPVVRKESTFLAKTPQDVDDAVLELMKTHGIEAVRGGTWSSSTLCDDELVGLRNKIDASRTKDTFFDFEDKSLHQDLGRMMMDRRMNEESQPEWLKDRGCVTNLELDGLSPPREAAVCGKCGIRGHIRLQCKARKDLALTCERCGMSGHSQEKCVVNLDMKGNTQPCDKCGRTGHTRDKCWSKKDMSLICTKCGNKGHSQETCYVKNPGLKCARCGRSGHMVGTCNVKL